MNDVEMLIEERAILRLLHEYAHAMDYGHESRWVEIFAPDAVFDVVDVVGGKRVHREEGHADLARYVAGYPKPPRFRKHVVVDPMIDIAPDGQRATVEAYWLLLERHDENGRPVLAAFGHYNDELAKRDGRWMITKRYAEVESSNY